MEALSESAASAEYPSKNVTHIFSSTNLFQKMKENKALKKKKKEHGSMNYNNHQNTYLDKHISKEHWQ